MVTGNQNKLPSFVLLIGNENQIPIVDNGYWLPKIL